MKIGVDVDLCWEIVPRVPYNTYLISPSNNNVLIMLTREIRVVHLSSLNTINTLLTNVTVFFSHVHSFCLCPFIMIDSGSYNLYDDDSGSCLRYHTHLVLLSLSHLWL